MTGWDIGMNHIVDVDGQLLAIDADVVDGFSLLRRASRPADRELYQVRAGERFRVRPGQPIQLSGEEVLFFESAPTASAVAQRLAA